MLDRNDEFNPADALAAIDRARAAPMARMDAIAWRYDLLYAALCGLLVAAQSVPLPLNVGGDAAVIGGMVALMRWHRAQTGICINGLSLARSRWVALGIGAVAAVAAIGAAIEAHGGRAWVGAPVGIGMGLVALAASRLWRRVYRDEIAVGEMPIALGGGRFGLGGGLWLIASLGLVVCLVGAGLALYHVGDFAWATTLGVGVGMTGVALVKALTLRLKAR